MFDKEGRARLTILKGEYTYVTLHWRAAQVWRAFCATQSKLCGQQGLLHPYGVRDEISERANEAIFQLMMLDYNLFLLFKMDFANGTEYRQQIKTFRHKYIFLAGKIIRMARTVVLKIL